MIFALVVRGIVWFIVVVWFVAVIRFDLTIIRLDLTVIRFELTAIRFTIIVRLELAIVRLELAIVRPIIVDEKTITRLIFGVILGNIGFILRLITWLYLTTSRIIFILVLFILDIRIFHKKTLGKVFLLLFLLGLLFLHVRNDSVACDLRVLHWFQLLIFILVEHLDPILSQPLCGHGEYPFGHNFLFFLIFSRVLNYHFISIRWILEE